MMLSIETQLIILVILMILLLLFGWHRSWLFQRATKEKDPFPQLADLTPRTIALIYLQLLGGTWLMLVVILMFSLSPLTLTLVLPALVLPETIWAVGLPLILSFFLILALQKVLSLMRQYKQLSISLLINFSVLLVCLMISTIELSFLYWMKEITIYFSPPFLIFVVLYSLLILWIASVLSLNTHNKLWLKNWEFISVAVLDSALVVLSATIFLQIILVMIFQLGK
ncbi:MAG: hypothetical protein HC877_03200 [Thioploca sp.]|nr:hypothetical protein [Thioploca sp.]